MTEPAKNKKVQLKARSKSKPAVTTGYSPDIDPVNQTMYSRYPELRRKDYIDELTKAGVNYATLPITTTEAYKHEVGEEASKDLQHKKYYVEQNKANQPRTKAQAIVKRQSANDRLKAKYGKDYNPEAVRAKQRKLLKAGYDLGKWGVDGDWGETSQKAWAEYEAKEKLKKNMKFTPSQTTDELPTSEKASEESPSFLSTIKQKISDVDSYLGDKFWGARISEARTLGKAGDKIYQYFTNSKDTPVMDKVNTSVIPLIWYSRGAVDTNNFIAHGQGYPAVWGNDMLTPEMQERVNYLAKKQGNGTFNGYEDTIREGSSAENSTNFAVANTIGGGITHDNNTVTDSYDWGNYGDVSEATRKFKKNVASGGYSGVLTGVKNYMEWAAPYLMKAVPGSINATDKNGNKIAGFTDEELEQHNGWWQEAPQVKININR